MKEFYYERYMSQLRNKILEHDKKPSPSNSRRSSVKSAPQQVTPPGFSVTVVLIAVNSDMHTDYHPLFLCFLYSS